MAFFLGVTEDHTKFIAYCFEKKKVITHRNMHFDETVFPFVDDPTLAQTLFEAVTSDSADAGTDVPTFLEFDDAFFAAIEFAPSPSADETPLDDPDPPQNPSPAGSPQAAPRPPRAPRAPRAPEPPATPRQPYITRSGRESKAPTGQYSPNQYARNINAEDVNSVPTTWNEMLASPDRDDWYRAVNREMQSLHEMDAFEVVPLTDEIKKRCLRSRFVFKEKFNHLNQPISKKARFVACGYSQVEGADYDLTYSPVGDPITIRTLLTTAATFDYPVRHYDAEVAFLHSGIDREIYIMPPPSPYSEPGTVWLLKKSLYGLRQSPRNWFIHLTDLLFADGFEQSEADPCLFFDHHLGVWLLIYVDDVLAMAPTEEILKGVFTRLSTHLALKDLGPVSNFLGWEIDRKDDHFEVSQVQYILAILERFNMHNCRPASSPMDTFTYDEEQPIDLNYTIRDIIGCLQYLAHKTRPDIAATVQYLSQFMHKPTKALYNACCNVLRYLRGTITHKLSLGASPGDGNVAVYTDAHYGPRSVSGIVIKLFGATIFWTSRRQEYQSLSSAEAELYALAEGFKEICSLALLMRDFLLQVKFFALSDNQPALYICLNGTSSKTKHVQVRQPFIRQTLTRNSVQLCFVPAQHQLADLLTKPLNRTSLGKGGVLKIFDIYSGDFSNLFTSL